MKKNIARHSNASGYKKSLLPEFSETDGEYVKGTLDFVGISMYTADIAKSVNSSTDSCLWKDAMEVEIYQPSTWKNTSTSWLKVSRLMLGTTAT